MIVLGLNPKRIQLGRSIFHWGAMSFFPFCGKEEKLETLLQ